jgi:hypothetical protein
MLLTSEIVSFKELMFLASETSPGVYALQAKKLMLMPSETRACIA